MRKKAMATIRTLLVVAIFLPACAAQPDAMNTPAIDRIVQAARADAAQRSGLAAAQLQLVAAESVTWADGSMGCPRPGMLYTQALVPGYRVKLKVGSEVWDYHAGERGGLVLCPPGRSAEPGPGSRN
jgi:outer membrane lipoprotein-sorting protein